MPDPNDRVLQGDDDVAIAPIDIQFDQAEYTTPAPEGPSCGVCQRPINGEYYETSGKVLCSSCRDRVTAAFRGGSRTARVLRALLFGSVASGIGAALYYAILSATGYNIGWLRSSWALWLAGPCAKARETVAGDSINSSLSF